MNPQPNGGLVAEARLDGTALMQMCLGNPQHRCVVAGAATDPSKCDMSRRCPEVTSAYPGTVGLRICATCSTIKS